MTPTEGIDYGTAGTDKSSSDVQSLDMLLKLIAEKHKVALDKDDPLLIQHTMHTVFINDLKRIVDIFGERTRKILEESGEATAGHVRECLQVLKDETLDSSLKQTLARVAQEAATASSVKASLLRLRNATFVMVVLSWAALFLNIVLLARS